MSIPFRRLPAFVMLLLLPVVAAWARDAHVGHPFLATQPAQASTARKAAARWVPTRSVQLRSSRCSPKRRARASRVRRTAVASPT